MKDYQPEITSKEAVEYGRLFDVLVSLILRSPYTLRKIERCAEYFHELGVG